MTQPDGTPDHPWVLTTPSGGSEFTAYRDDTLDPAGARGAGGQDRSCATTCAASTTCTPCSSSAATGCPSGTPTSRSRPPRARVEAWARADDNPVGGWYGLKKGLRGRFANYVPPVLEALGLAEVEHNARNNRMRARPAS